MKIPHPILDALKDTLETPYSVDLYEQTKVSGVQNKRVPL